MEAEKLTQKMKVYFRKENYSPTTEISALNHRKDLPKSQVHQKTITTAFSKPRFLAETAFSIAIFGIFYLCNTCNSTEMAAQREQHTNVHRRRETGWEANTLSMPCVEFCTE